MRHILLLLVLSVCLCLGPVACTPEPEPEGVVAMVNGHPILLEQVKALYDLQFQAWPELADPTVSRLRADYGAMLGRLVIQELVYQGLAEHGISVSAEDLQQAEDEVRQDYPGDTFEQILTEEYIDITEWRAQLKANLAKKKFMQEVIRPQVKIDYLEAESYYRENLTEFVLPPRTRFLLFSGPVAEHVERASQAFAQGGTLESVQAEFPQVAVKELKLRDGQLSEGWRTLLQPLELGQVSPVQRATGTFEAVALLEHMPSRVLDASRAYPLVEKILMERKMNDAFNQWLQGALDTSVITVSRHLLPPEEGEEESGVNATEPEPVGGMS